MSIEQNLERIANALEAFVQIAGGKVSAPKPSAVVTGTPVTTPGVVLPSMTPPPPPPTMGPVPPTADAGYPLPANGEQLRALAASVAQTLGKDAKTAPKVLVFSNWVSTMLQPYGVSKLIDVNAESIPAVTKAICDWAKNEGINV